MFDGSERSDDRIVDDDIETAMAVVDLSHHRLDFGLLRQICPHERRRHPEPGGQIGGRLAAIIETVQHDVCAGGGKLFGYRKSKASGGACHQGVATLQGWFFRFRHDRDLTTTRTYWARRR